MFVFLFLKNVIKKYISSTYILYTVIKVDKDSKIS